MCRTCHSAEMRNDFRKERGSKAVLCLGWEMLKHVVYYSRESKICPRREWEKELKR